MMKKDSVLIDNEKEKTSNLGFLIKLGVFLGILLLGVLAYFWLAKTKPTVKPIAKSNQAPTVQVAPLKLENVQIPIEVSGLVEALKPRNLSANVSGQVTFVSNNLQDEGFIRKGERLLSVDNSQRQSELSRLRAQVSSAKSALNSAQMQANHNREALKDLGIKATATPPQVVDAQTQLRAVQEQYAIAQKQASRSSMVAPYNARILKAMINVGDFASPGVPIAQTIANDKALVKLAIGEKEYDLLDRSQFGQGASMSINLQDNNGDQQWQGEIIGSEKASVATNQLHTLKAHIFYPFDESNGGGLSIGSSVSAELTSKQLENIIKVDAQHIHNGNEVWIYNQGKLNIRPLDVIYRAEEFTYGRVDIKAGDKLITSYINLPIEGMPLRISK